MKIIIFLLLFVGFWGMFQSHRWYESFLNVLGRTKWEMDEAARQRALENRRQLLLYREKRNLWRFLERELYYSGFKLYFPKLTAELFLAGNMLVLAGGVFLAVAKESSFGWLIPVALLGAEYLVFGVLKSKNLKAVNENMMKLLDFLANYSITTGELTGVLQQVSRYMEEPLKSVLEACFYEVQITGDVQLALLAMAEKIEHPKFKELAENMEISTRYCADFTALVNGCKRSLREYLKNARERKGMLYEAIISMALLLGMSVVILCMVAGLVGQPITELLWGNISGRIGLTILLVIGLLFISQLQRIHY